MNNAPTQAYIKPSDASSWALCARRVWLDNKGELEVEEADDAFEALIIELGLAHEQAVLTQIMKEKSVHTATSPEDTQRLMAEGVDVIYQAQLLDKENLLVGYPDFLIRHTNGEYQPADAKLSVSEDKKEIQVQLGFYRRMLNANLPAIVFLGDGDTAEISDETNPLTNQFVTEMRELLASDTEPLVRYSHSKCRACPYYTHCKPAFEAKEEISLLYGVQGRAADGLEKHGISTISELATSSPESLPDVPYLKGYEKKQRAILQAQSYFSGEVHQIAPVSLPDGHWVHFDIEDNPLTGNGEKHVYLWGFLVPNFSNADFEYVWTDTAEQDKQGWIEFLAKIEEYRDRYADLVLAHYSQHERTTIRSYAKRYDMESNETVLYLLGEESPLFDMQKPVLDSLVLPLQGYGLKDICKHKDLVNFQWEDDNSGSQWSVVQFNRFLAESDPEMKAQLKAEILGYNRDDVIATRRLEEWLRAKFM
ncbi:TM0106 family RecB-like putative nuclease [Neptuniibacter marinus]|uniref:TM0106 family RecB-like putative nuclease n=1 Tax=Neptuniibacter marinus TaxID=1806670 RepID=UPI003B592B63